MPASTERNPVYVRGGSTVVRDVGLFAGAPETRRLTARVYGDESLPFTMQANGEKVRLTWRDGKGSSEGETGYDVRVETNGLRPNRNDGSANCLRS
jgi:hypothetical protein